MSSPGIDKWIQEAPESWAKLANTKNKKIGFNQWKKQFFEGAKTQNKDYLEKYLTNDQLKTIYTKGHGGTLTTSTSQIKPIQTKPTKITVRRNQKEYMRTVNPRWNKQTEYILKLAANTKPRSTEHKKYVDILG